MSKLVAASLSATFLLVAAAPAWASEPSPDEGGYAGPLTAGIGLAVAGGGVGILAVAEDDDVTIGGSVLTAFGVGGLMGGVALWMMDDLSEAEAEDKVRQGGVALTTVGTGAASIGGLMIMSSYLDVSDVNESTRVAGIFAAGGGGAALIAGLIMYAVGGPPPDPAAEKAADGAALRFDVGAGNATLELTF